MKISPELKEWLSESSSALANFTSDLEYYLAQKKLVPGRELNVVMGALVGHAVQHVGLAEVLSTAHKVAAVIGANPPKKGDKQCQN